MAGTIAATIIDVSGGTILPLKRQIPLSAPTIVGSITKASIMANTRTTIDESGTILGLHLLRCHDPMLSEPRYVLITCLYFIYVY